MRSPIEIMIDKACGYIPTSSNCSVRLRLRCPDCERVSKHIEPMQKDDVVEGVFIVLRCPECWDKANG